MFSYRLKIVNRASSTAVIALAMSACGPSGGDGAAGTVSVAVTGDAQVAAPAAIAPTSTPTPVPSTIATATVKNGPLFGATLSGAEASGGDVLRPTLSDLQGYIDYYGFRLIRYPLIDNRMTAARIVELRTFTDYARSRNVPVILDNHTFKWLPVQQAVDWWTTFAKNFPDDGSVMLELVNEPNKGFDDPVLANDWAQWIRDSKLIIAGLRANGIKHPVLLEYPQYSATFRFDKKESITKSCESAACAIDRSSGAIDPLGRTYISAHRYFDTGSAGASKVCTATSSGWSEFAASLRKRGLKAYITESAFGSSYGVHSSCAAVANEAITTLKANSDVLLGITWWGGGRIWPETYIFKIEPQKAQRFSIAVPAYMLSLLGSGPIDVRGAI